MDMIEIRKSLSIDCLTELFIEDYEHLKCDDTLEFYKRIIWDTINNYDFSDYHEGDASTFIVEDWDENSNLTIPLTFTISVFEEYRECGRECLWRLHLWDIFVDVHDGNGNLIREPRLGWTSNNGGVIVAEDYIEDYIYR